MARKMTRRGAKKVTAAVRDYQVLIKPVITEKSSIIGGDGSQVVFKVDKKASKTEIKGAVERIYDVKVAAVRTCNFLGKVKRTTRKTGRTTAFKKAYISLQEGFSIDIVEGL